MQSSLQVSSARLPAGSPGSTHRQEESHRAYQHHCRRCQHHHRNFLGSFCASSRSKLCATDERLGDVHAGLARRQAPGLKSGGGRRGWHSRCLTGISGRASSLQSARALWMDDVLAFRSGRNGRPCVAPLFHLIGVPSLSRWWRLSRARQIFFAGPWTSRRKIQKA